MNHHTRETLIAFEDRIKAHWEAGDLPTLLHLCGGNEDQLIEIFKQIEPGDWVFSSHRSHYHALLAGIPEAHLESEIMAGRSMFIFWNAAKRADPSLNSQPSTLNFFSSAILAGTACIAAGVAWDIRQKHLLTIPREYYRVDIDPAPARPREPRVWCFLGDGASENGHFAEAVQFVAGHDLPCTFVIEDNDRQVDTDKRTRRGFFHDDWKRNIIWPPCVRSYHYRPTYPHAGSGCKFQITFKPEAIRRLQDAGRTQD